MKLKILGLLVFVLSLPIKLFRPFKEIFKRIFYLVLAEGQISGIDSSVQFDGRLNAKGTKRIKFGKNARIGENVELETCENGSIKIGEEVRINKNATIVSYSGITIGAYTMIGEFVSIRDANHGILSGEFIKHQAHTTKPITIGKDVWIGRGVCILPGVEIGDGAIIGANSVVTKSIPSKVIAVGMPAKVLKERV